MAVKQLGLTISKYTSPMPRLDVNEVTNIYLVIIFIAIKNYQIKVSFFWFKNIARNKINKNRLAKQ